MSSGNLEKNSSTFAWDMISARVEVEVVEARGLSGFGTIDPWGKVTVQEVEQKLKQLTDASNPRWRTKLQFSVVEVTKAKGMVEIFARRLIGKDSLLCRFVLDFSKIAAGDATEGEFVLFEALSPEERKKKTKDKKWNPSELTVKMRLIECPVRGNIEDYHRKLQAEIDERLRQEAAAEEARRQAEEVQQQQQAEAERLRQEEAKRLAAEEAAATTEVTNTENTSRDLGDRAGSEVVALEDHSGAVLTSTPALMSVAHYDALPTDQVSAMGGSTVAAIASASVMAHRMVGRHRSEKQQHLLAAEQNPQEDEAAEKEKVKAATVAAAFHRRVVDFFQAHGIERSDEELQRISDAWGPSHEEQLFHTLIQKYGSPEEQRQDQAEHDASSGFKPDLEFHRRLTEFYSLHAPEKVSKVDIILETYQGKEEQLFTILEKRYAGEDPEDVKNPYRPRLERFFTVYCPERLPAVFSILRMYAGREDWLFSTLVKKYGREPVEDGRAALVDAGVVAPEEAAHWSYAQRLTAFYQRYAPEKIPKVEEALKMYVGREETLFQQLEAHYCPEGLCPSLKLPPNSPLKKKAKDNLDSPSKRPATESPAPEAQEVDSSEKKVTATGTVSAIVVPADEEEKGESGIITVEESVTRTAGDIDIDENVPAATSLTGAANNEGRDNEDDNIIPNDVEIVVDEDKNLDSASKDHDVLGDVEYDPALEELAQKLDDEKNAKGVVAENVGDDATADAEENREEETKEASTAESEKSFTATKPPRERLELFYTVYSPEKLPMIDRALEAYQGREEELFAALTSKFGPEPTDPKLIEESRAKNEKKQLRADMLKWFVVAGKGDTDVDEILVKYEGKEKELRGLLENKYGPVPSQEAVAKAHDENQRRKIEKQKEEQQQQQQQASTQPPGYGSQPQQRQDSGYGGGVTSSQQNFNSNSSVSGPPPGYPHQQQPPMNAASGVGSSGSTNAFNAPPPTSQGNFYQDPYASSMPPQQQQPPAGGSGGYGGGGGYPPQYQQQQGGGYPPAQGQGAGSGYPLQPQYGAAGGYPPQQPPPGGYPPQAGGFSPGSGPGFGAL